MKGAHLVAFLLAASLPMAGAAEDKAANATCACPAFIRDSQVLLNARLYYLNKHCTTPADAEALALGGSLDYTSGKWQGLSIGLTPYTSQKLYGPDGRDGTGLLAPGQESYTVLGQAYLQAERWNNTLRLYKQMLDTPFINPRDSKMTPITEEAYTWENTTFSNWSFLVSQVQKIKLRNASTFQSLTAAAGVAGADKPVTLGGATFQPNDRATVQLWEYYGYDFMNIAYLQGDLDIPLNDDWTLDGSVQGCDQQSVGDDLGGDFHTGMGGIMLGVDGHGWEFDLGGNQNANNHDLWAAWGSYAGYTSLMVEDNELAGEKSWLAHVAYDFSRLGATGLGAFLNHTESWLPDNGRMTAPAQRETNLTADYEFGGLLQGLRLRLRGARVEGAQSFAGADVNEIRAQVTYSRMLF